MPILRLFLPITKTRRKREPNGSRIFWSTIANYALVDILTYKKSWIPWKNLVKKHGDIKIFLSPEIATADRKIIQQHLIERLSATENELSLRVSN